MMVYKRAAATVNLRNQHFQNVDFEGRGLKAATPPPWGCAWAPLGALGPLWGALGAPLGCPWGPWGAPEIHKNYQRL